MNSHSTQADRVGGLILCGGQSRRMGRPKAWLPFGDESSLQRVARLLGSVLNPIVVVAAANQELPPLPPGIRVARDDRPGRGPLEGLRAGLGALAGQVDAVFTTSCDVPLLEPALVRRMVELLGEFDVAVPVDGEFHHPLAAVYRMSVLGHVLDLLAADRLRPFFLFERVPTRRVPVDELRSVDPDLRSLMNLNEEADYRRALELAHLTGGRPS